MKQILIFPVFLIIVLSFFGTGCEHDKLELQKFPSDTIDVYARLESNDLWYFYQRTYGRDSIVGSRIQYRATTDSSNIHIDYDITILELYPRITDNLLSFVHEEMLNWGFVDEADTVVPFGIKEMTDKGFTQQDIVHKAIDWECDMFYKIVPDILSDDGGFFLNIEIYPVFLNDDFVTYKKYVYIYTGGAHGNYSSFLQTYNRKTGESVDLEDMIKPDKMGEVRKRVILHMASNYPIYSTVTNIENYFDSVNRWKGYTDIRVALGIRNDEDREKITMGNYPLNDPVLHEAGLVFTYERYHLTPGCDGVSVILLTYDEIRDCLKEPFRSYYTNPSKLKGVEESDIYSDKAAWYSEEQLDSVRVANGYADDGKLWPRDIFDWYKYRYGDVERHYPIDELIGTWIGYGHRYDPREILNIYRDGTFMSVEEEALNEDANGNMRYSYNKTTRGKYHYDQQKNKFKFINWEVVPLNDENLEAYIKQRDPWNRYMIIHSVEGDTMYIADEIGDLWPFIRQK